MLQYNFHIISIKNIFLDFYLMGRLDVMGHFWLAVGSVRIDDWCSMVYGNRLLVG